MGLHKVLLGSVGPAIEWMMQQPKGLPMVRVVCPPRFVGDPIGQGNVLAGAINHDLKLDLLGQGLPWSYGTTLLRLHQHTLGPLAMMVFCAENAPEMALDLMGLENLQLTLHFSFEVPEQLAGCEIVELSSKPNPPSKRPTTLTALRMRMNGDLERENWVAALSIAAPHFPEELPGLLQKCGWSLLEEGLAHRLEQEFASVKGEFAHHPEVLRWRLAAAFNGWNQAELLPLVGEVLQTHDHPELRSYYALGLHVLYRYEEGQQQIGLALEASGSAVVLANAGYIAQRGDLEHSLIWLGDALKKAELENLPLLQAQISVSLAQGHIQDCNPQKAYEWAGWAMRVMECNGLNNAPLRLMALNELAYARVLQGDTLGLEPQLKQEAECLAHANRRVRNFLDSTLANVLMVEGKPGEAAYVMEQIWNRIQQRESFGIFAMPYVLALLEIGEIEKANEVATKACSLNQPEVRTGAGLAALVVQSLQNPDLAIKELQALLEKFTRLNVGNERLRTSLYLARALLAVGQTEEADALLRSLQPLLSRFSTQGLKALVGPSEAFVPLLARLDFWKEDLELEFMGQMRARLHGKLINLRPRQADVLTAMTLNPSGHTVEQMALDLYGEKGSPASARAEIHRLAELVPIESRPYRINVTYKTDFLEIKKYLSLGDVRGALNLYRGPLLPQSSAPAVEQERYLLEDTLREAVARSSDPEAILALCQILKDDLELLELAVERVSKIDPRGALAEARRRQVAQSWIN